MKTKDKVKDPRGIQQKLQDMTLKGTRSFSSTKNGYLFLQKFSLKTKTFMEEIFNININMSATSF